MSFKIAFIGAGSIGFTRRLLADLLTVPEFHDLEVAFTDINPHNLDMVTQLCQRDIAAKILKSTGNITLVIDNLEKRGLVRRERDAADRRYLTVYLTDAGTKLIAKTFTDVEAAIVAEMAVLEPQEQELLGALCKKLGLKGEGSRLTK